MDDAWDQSTLSAVLFVVLCLQSNITGLTVNKRLAKLYRNLWLLAMASLHSFETSIDKMLTHLTATRDFALTKHLRPLFVLSFIFAVPFLFLKLFWHDFGEQMYNPWILSLALFAAELLFKVSTCLIIYVVNATDSLLLNYNPNAEMVVDVLQIIRALGEFIFGVLLFINGLWILIYDYGGVLRSIMICIHAYFNIYQQFMRGWDSFRKWTLCTRRLDALKTATLEEILEHDDLCPICFQELTVGSTKITSCSHYYHVLCLRKLLLRQDTCPLCHKMLSALSEN